MCKRDLQMCKRDSRNRDLHICKKRHTYSIQIFPEEYAGLKKSRICRSLFKKETYKCVKETHVKESDMYAKRDLHTHSNFFLESLEVSFYKYVSLRYVSVFYTFVGLFYTFVGLSYTSVGLF